MKKNLLFRKSALILSASVLMFSCLPDSEAPVIQEESNLVEVLSTPAEGGENLRKAVERNYFERFENNLKLEPGPGFTGGPDNAFYPGTGKGNSTHMGKALTFLNQFAQFGTNGLETVGSPVTMIFADELAALGLTSIPDNVSSITTDGKGNSIWFEAVSNSVTPTSETRADFVAQVKIVGGTGKFEYATGEGEVVGFFNPEDGKGSSTMRGRIIY